jgi:4-hydroxy-4-methyl-2-oxoglutarate aldolase
MTSGLPAADSARRHIRSRFLEIDTAMVADILDELNRPDQALAPGIGPVVGERIAGWAFTIRGQSEMTDLTGDAVKMRACGEIGRHQIAVWAGGGSGIAYFGELIALGMQQQGCEGAVVAGGVRDTAALRNAGFPVFAHHVSPVQSIGRWRVDSWQVPLDVPGATTPTVTIAPDDFLLGDGDGVVVIPAELIEPVLERAAELTAAEAEIRAALASGASLSECLSRFGHV